MPQRHRDKMQVEFYPYTTMALQRGGWSTPHTLATLPLRQRPGIPCTGCSLGLYTLSCHHTFAALTHKRLIWCSLLVSLFVSLFVWPCCDKGCSVIDLSYTSHLPENKMTPFQILCTITRSPFLPHQIR